VDRSIFGLTIKGPPLSDSTHKEANGKMFLIPPQHLRIAKLKRRLAHARYRYAVALTVVINLRAGKSRSVPALITCVKLARVDTGQIEHIPMLMFCISHFYALLKFYHWRSVKSVCAWSLCNWTLSVGLMGARKSVRCQTASWWHLPDQHLVKIYDNKISVGDLLTCPITGRTPADV